MINVMLNPKQRTANSAALQIGTCVTAFIGEDSEEITLSLMCEACDVLLLLSTEEAQAIERELHDQIAQMHELEGEPTPDEVLEVARGIDAEAFRTSDGYRPVGGTFDKRRERAIVKAKEMISAKPPK
jgi:hypothetical protein